MARMATSSGLSELRFWLLGKFVNDKSCIMMTSTCPGVGGGVVGRPCT